MTDLHNTIWIEKYRPQSLDDLIFSSKDAIQSILKNPAGVPSMIFYSSRPGTGKTSLAKLIIKELDCDSLVLNSSLDRSIEFVREQVSHFARCLSSVEGVKRCVFLDEADGLTRQAQDSLRNLMEEYSENCFFIFTANDVNKIIEPIASRCQVFAFEKPSKAEIIMRLDTICEAEKLDITPELLEKLVDKHYPDMRKMIGSLQLSSIKGEPVSVEDDTKRYKEFLDYLKTKNVKGVSDMVYSGEFDMLGFNHWYFHTLYENYKTSDFDKTRQIALRLADTEHYSALNCNLELVFIANCLEIMRLL